MYKVYLPIQNFYYEIIQENKKKFKNQIHKEMTD